MTEKIETDISAEAARETIRNFISKEWVSSLHKDAQEKFNGADPTPKKKPVAIAILDKRGCLKAFHSMDGTTPIASEWSIAKARTAFKFEADTIDLKNSIPLKFDELCLYGGLYGGGIPIKNIKGAIIGAIGISGRDSSEENHNLAIEALYCLATIIYIEEREKR